MTVTLNSDTEEMLLALAKQRGQTPEEIVEDCISREYEAERSSRFDDIIGIGEGPSDLARRHKEIFGEIMDGKC